MTTYYDSIFTALNNLLTINADDINSTNLNVSNETTMNNATVKNLTIIDSLLFPLNFMWSNLINQNPLLTGTNHLVATNFNNNITQSNGSCQLLDTNIGSISQSETSVIIQSGNQWNQLKQTQVTDLSITGTLSLPNNIVISGSTYNDDLIINNATIQQTAPPDQINTFGATDFYNGDVRLNKNLTMIGGAETVATLKNLKVDGNSNMGLIISPTITDLDTRITTNKNDIISINSNLILKADKTYTDSQLALKANLDYVNNQLLLKDSVISVDNKILNLQNQINIIDDELILKDNITDVDNKVLNLQNQINTIDDEIILKDNITDVDNKVLNLQTQINTIDDEIILKDNIIDVDAKILNLQNQIDIIDDEIILKDNIIDVDIKVLNLQNQIDDIIASEYYESIAIGTITTLEPDQAAYVINSGTNINAILDFGIPKGYKGDKGDKGDRGPSGDDGKDGSDGSNGSDGAPGDSSAATISAGIAAGAAAAAAAEAGVAVAAASASAASAASAAASAALANGKNLELETKVTGLQTQVDTLGQGMTQLDNDVIALKTKTQYMTAGVGITTINSTLNTNDINANNLYVANDLIVVDEVKASKFSGGFLSTQIGGSNINIGTNETLINTINIGGPTTITTISGIVNYSNPLNSFFNQWS